LSTSTAERRSIHSAGAVERGRRNVGSEDAPTLKLIPFTEGLFKVKAFLDPVLAEDGEGHWAPEAELWAL
jgi:hypothetical protein